MTEQSRSNPIGRTSNDVLEATSFFSAANAPYIEALYAQWLENPDVIEPSWAEWFAELGRSGFPPLRETGDWRRALSSGADGELIGALTGLWPPRKGEASAADTRSAAKD